jgi:hypothetical protein
MDNEQVSISILFNLLWRIADESQPGAEAPGTSTGGATASRAGCEVRSGPAQEGGARAAKKQRVKQPEKEKGTAGT